MTTSIHNDGIARQVLASTGNPTQYGAVARALVASVADGGPGTTVNGHGFPYTGDGLIVADGEHGQVLWNDDDPEGRPVADYVLAWVLAVAPVITSRADYFYGIWADEDGYLHLDVSQVFSREDRIYALHAINVRGERCGWDNGRKECI